ncbi:MAG TPA: hypothetical protein DIC30_05835 [Oceanospirillales bacterium]|jgi:hypothetical protein|nr:hypothetical protein [Oceanospirillales bacterium]|tara:strand:- start:684 stop:1217 length:534 start_codon:yes stop_codon:yes gene_type:complete
MKTPLLIMALSIVVGGLHVFVQANDNLYYTDDLDVAVKDAKEAPSGNDIVGNRWYNRTTSKSFDFPKLLNQEMSTEIVDGALDATAAGPGDVAPERTSPLELSEVEASVSEKDNEEMELLSDRQANDIIIATEVPVDINQLEPTVIRVQRIEYQGNDFSGSATDIQSSATSRAYTTP